MAGTTEGMTPAMHDAVSRLLWEAGGRVWIVSGYRSTEEQQVLYDRYLAGTGNLAAKPGTSLHEHGTAVDFGGDLDLVARLAAKYGLAATVKGEPWHYSLVNASATTSTSTSTSTGGSTTVAGTSTQPAPAGAPGGAPYRIPTDGRVVSVGGQVYVLHDLGAGVWISYKVTETNTDLGGRQPEIMSQAKYNELTPVNGGDARELDQVARNYGSYTTFWDSILTQTMGPNPAKNDPEIRRVIAEFAGRPDMSPEELQNRLRETEYWNSRTDQQREWNDLSDAEKNYRQDGVASQLAQQFYEATGQLMSVTDPRMKFWALKVASGEMGQGEWFETVVKPFALSMGESPLSRQVRQEEETQRQRGIDIENRAEQIRSMYRRWGVPVSDESIKTWAQRMIENRSSEEDLLGFLRDQATILYPNKDPEIETALWAEPWLQTYQRVMETGQVDLTHKDIQAALTNGTPIYEFEQQLKMSDDWLKTKGAQEEYSKVGFEVGQLMGFN